MELKRKQVKALLDVISNDDSRAISAAFIDKHENDVYLVATDGYKFAALKLEAKAEIVAGQFVNREKITTWFKLANSKSVFTSETVVELAGNDVMGKFPEWQKHIDMPAIQQMPVVRMNAKYYLTMCELAGNLSLGLSNHGVSQFMAKENDNYYIVMGLK